MGNNLDQLPKVDPIDFDFTKRSDFLENSNKKYYFRYFKDYQRASPIEKQFLASQVVDLFKTSFLTTNNIDDWMSYYFNFPNAVGVDLIFIIDKKSQKAQGFTIYTIIEVCLEPGNNKQENKYLVSTGLAGINPEYRRAGVYRDIFFSSFYLNIAKYPNKNYIHYDVSINPISFYIVNKSSWWVFPGPGKELNCKQMDFFIKLIGAFECSSVVKEKPYLVYEPNVIDESEKNNWRSGYADFPEEIKFFIDQTKLENDIGIAFIAAGLLIEGNTLGLPAKNYIAEERPNVEIVEHTFKVPKL